MSAESALRRAVAASDCVVVGASTMFSTSSSTLVAVRRMWLVSETFTSCFSVMSLSAAPLWLSRIVPNIPNATKINTMAETDHQQSGDAQFTHFPLPVFKRRRPSTGALNDDGSSGSTSRYHNRQIVTQMQQKYSGHTVRLTRPSRLFSAAAIHGTVSWFVCAAISAAVIDKENHASTEKIPIPATLFNGVDGAGRRADRRGAGPALRLCQSDDR